MKNDNVYAQHNGPSLPRARARFLAQAIQLEEQEPKAIINAAIYFTAFILLAAIIWAALTKVDEVTSTRGEIIPAGLIQDIQHLEGGIVKEIKVRNGDHVKKGDLLLRFAPPAIQSELEQLEVQRITLILEAERLQAIIEGRLPKFSSFSNTYPALAHKQLTIYNAQNTSHKTELKVIDSQITQRKKELKQLRNRAKSADKKLTLLKEQARMFERLADTNAISRSEVIDIRTKLAETESERNSAYDSIRISQSALKESEQRKDEYRANFIKETELEAGNVAKELARVKQEVVRVQDKVNRLRVFAPLDGIVQDLSITRINAVVEPGQVIMQLVPTDGNVIVEARIPPSEIGHISVGQKAEVKVDSYDSARFGIAFGIVERISASTYLNEKKEPYFRTEISLNNNWVGDAPELKITPGMTVTADIKTGSKSVMDYLLKPVSRGLDTAFRER